MNRNIRQHPTARERECSFDEMQGRQSRNRIAETAQAIDQHPLDAGRIELQ
jgi:hypothetical protein